MARFLSKDQLALYRLIWERFLASQMLPAVYDTVAADITAGRRLFRAPGLDPQVRGLHRGVRGVARGVGGARRRTSRRPWCPPLVEGEVLRLRSLDPKQHFTQPPPRYTEASLVKTLEELGIGRPSTYAQILGTIQDRGVRAAREGRRSSPPSSACR